MTVRGEPPARVVAAVEALNESLDSSTSAELIIAAQPGDQSAQAGLDAWAGRGSLVANPSGERSPGLNRAARAASGDILVRVDARTRPPVGYVERCGYYLDAHPAVGVVGGHQVPLAASDRLVARAVARALQNPLVVGGAAYRRVDASGNVDTVYLGAFRRDEFLRIGGYDEGLRANEDFDLCARYLASGKKVWLLAGLDVTYIARATLRGVWDQYVAFGRAKVDYWALRHQPPNGRQLAALLGACVVVSVLPPIALANRSRLVGLGLAGGAGLLVVDRYGNRRVASVPERGISAVVSAVIALAWVYGIVVGTLWRAGTRLTRSRACAVGPPSPTGSSPGPP
jgi:GT2 family glycosyltransferase